MLVLALALAAPSAAVTARWSFVEAYDNGGDWYIGYDNSSATLAWGESYVMMGLAAMFRVTGDPSWLDELARHADSAVAMMDRERGVVDYRGVSEACWQDTHYQPAGEAYCYVVHSGMIGQPIAEFARLVAEAGLEAEVAYDGETFGDKADRYVAAMEDVVAAHADQWTGEGYAFRADATFLGYPGVDLPINQSAAMGRLLLTLADVDGSAEHLAKAEAICRHFRDQLAADGDGWVWNYWGGAYSAPGEDVSHGAIEVDLARMCAERGLVFDDDDMRGFAATFMDRVYVDDRTFSDHVGGGSTNTESYRPQVARWLGLTPWRTGLYTAVRDLYDLDYPPSSVGSGSILYGWGLLAEHEPVHCEPFFYYVDWDDPDPDAEGDWREATAYGANILTTPPDLDAPCMIPLEVDAPRQVEVQQWDGAAYHRVAEWEATGGETRRFVPYEPAWPTVYWSDGVLFQFADAFVEGDGIRVRESTGLAPPTITSTPPESGEDGVLDYAAEGEGDAPFWWSLAAFPTGARIDPETGELRFEAPGPGAYAFTVVLENDAGSDSQSFTWVVPPSGGDTGGGETGAADTGAPDTGWDDSLDTCGIPDESEDTAAEVGATPGACGCGGGAAGVLLLPLALARRRREA